MIGDSEVADIGGTTAGWYPDPSGRFDARFHNGQDWTADVSINGDRFVDPLGASPTANANASNDDGPSPTRNPLATAAMVLGIVSLFTTWMPFVFIGGVVAAVLALVLGIVGLRRSQGLATGRSLALTGIITGAIGLVLGIVGALFSIIVYTAMESYGNPSPHMAEITACEQVGSSVTLTGEITNIGDTAASFSVDTAFVRGGTNNSQRRVRVAVDDVAPGATAEFSVQREVALDDVDCIIDGVDGPLPFGIEID